MKNFKLTKSSNEKRRVLAFLAALVVLGTASVKEEAQAIDLRNRERNTINILSHNTMLRKSEHEVDVIDINTPNGNGISYNVFRDFNVGTGNGVIFNNSTEDGKSVIGGDVSKNLNLNGTSARAILNEVTGNTPSSIKGEIEVFGDKADFILANENGIMVNNANFINTAGVTLTTGKVSFDESTVNFDVKNGEVILNDVESAGTYFDVYAQAIEIQGKISAANSNITMVEGENHLQCDISNLENINILSSELVPNKNHGIYGTELGAMYGRNIKLIGTGSVLGVRHDGLIFSTEDIKIDSKGTITLKNVNSQGKLEISGKNIVLEKNYKSSSENGNILANDDIKIKATHNIINNGKISGNENINITSGESIFNNENSSISAEKDLELNAKKTIDNKAGSTIEAKGKKDLRAPEVKE